MHTETQKAYMAGMLDGEGHIGISMLPTRNRSRRHWLRVTLTNTNLEVLRELADEWGGKVVRLRQGNAERGWRVAGDISWSTNAARQLLEEVQPYLRIKREQCRIALEFLATIAPLEHKSRPVTEEMWEQREGLRGQIGALNSRKIVRAKSPHSEKPSLTCLQCGTAFDSYQRLRKYCSPVCKDRAGRDAYEERTRSIKPCALCGTEFLARNMQKYCSIKCGRAMQPPHSTKPSETNWRRKQSPVAN